MPNSSFPFPSPNAARDGQHCSSTTDQQRVQFDINVLNKAQDNQEAASSRQEQYLYPEHDPLE